MAKKQSEKSDGIAPISAEAWEYIARISVKRVALKAKLADKVTTRDALKEELKAEGPKRTKKRLDLSADLVDTLEQIDAARVKMHEFSDQLDKGIQDAIQGKLPGMNDEKPEKPEAELYDDAKEAA